LLFTSLIKAFFTIPALLLGVVLVIATLVGLARILGFRH
jgi:hypothetical protein